MPHCNLDRQLNSTPSSRRNHSHTIRAAPFSDGKVWDPVGLSSEADPEDIKKWREAEIKHGRVAMLAAVGILVAEVSYVFCFFFSL